MEAGLAPLTPSSTYHAAAPPPPGCTWHARSAAAPQRRAVGRTGGGRSVSPPPPDYLNRLSDWLFTAARLRRNAQVGVMDIPWARQTLFSGVERTQRPRRRHGALAASTDHQDGHRGQTHQPEEQAPSLAAHGAEPRRPLGSREREPGAVGGERCRQAQRCASPYNQHCWSRPPTARRSGLGSLVMSDRGMVQVKSKVPGADAAAVHRHQRIAGGVYF